MLKFRSEIFHFVKLQEQKKKKTKGREVWCTCHPNAEKQF